ncbi:response regulator [Cyanobacteria bacterium FACHB-63]|nr:response regulator [Cyanobacteria bacterium FACHB-63]
MMVKRILMIDDDPLIREVTQICLETVAGWEVTTAGSGQEGLAKAETSQPDAILLDVMMPEMDGISTFQKLQSNPITQSIPVILLTAKVLPDDGFSYEEMGFKAVIVKPFEPVHLSTEIAQVLGWDTSGS